MPRNAVLSVRGYCAWLKSIMRQPLERTSDDVRHANAHYAGVDMGLSRKSNGYPQVTFTMGFLQQTTSKVIAIHGTRHWSTHLPVRIYFPSQPSCLRPVVQGVPVLLQLFPIVQLSDYPPELQTICLDQVRTLHSLCQIVHEPQEK